MKVIVAGGTGAIGWPLLGALVHAGHAVVAMSRSDDADNRIRQLGATPARVDALDRQAVRRLVGQSGAAAIIDELTSLPRSPAQLSAAAERDRRLRLEGGGNLLAAAEEFGVSRYIQQSSGFFLRAEQGLADERAAMRITAPGAVGASAAMYAELERRLLAARLDGVSLRYGFLYGPGTWYWPDGAVADSVRAGGMPIIGGGGAVWSFIHVEDAAAATCAALDAAPGLYNVVDDEPLAVADWLPAFARWIGAPPPPAISTDDAIPRFGAESVYYHTRLSGAANLKARAALRLSPRPLAWAPARD